MTWQRWIRCLLFSLCLVVDGVAQIRDSRGREFWLTFLPNFHNQRTSPNPAERLGDSLYIFIISDAPCRGLIEWWNSAGQREEERFVISDPRAPYVFARSWWGLELMGYNDSGTLLFSGPNEGGQCEKPVRQAFHVVVEEGGEVTVYALQQAVFTSDAFLTLPVDVLDREYLVMSYPSDGSVSGDFLASASTPSQFAIVAVEDQTHVTIRPSAPTYWNGLQEQNVILNRGEVYLVQARITPGNLRPDLTGTEIVASKPVAVFAGHQRATVPVEVPELTSRDILVEQLPPVSTWGRSAVVVHFPEPSTGADPRGMHVYRVLSAQPNTSVFVNGQQVAVLSRGEFYQAALTQPLEVQATGPVLVAVFHKTTNANRTDHVGDPFMMLIPPAQQFMPRYRFINAQKYDYNSATQRYEPVYRDQYATVVFPRGAELWLDGQRIPASLYRPIGASGYAYVWLPTVDGVHDVEARWPDGSPAGMGLYVYGYGPANSYGYVGGSSYRPLDVSPPRLLASQACFTVAGVVYDTASTDSRLHSVEVVRSQNVDVYIDPFPKPADSVRFRATLVDISADGFFRLRARDSVGYEQFWDFALPGFTLQVRPTQVRRQVLLDGRRYCQDFTVWNSGDLPKRVHQLRFVGTLPPQATVTAVLGDSVVLPGGEVRVQLCFVAAARGTYVARLLLADTCLVADSMAVVVVTIGADELPPAVQRQRDSCGWEEVLFVADTVEPASGIAAVEVLQQVNCTVTLLRQDSLRAVLQVRVLNPTEDAWYELRLRDRAGNERTVGDTLPGFTVQVIAPVEGLLTMVASSFGELRCDTVWLHNTGRFPMRLETVVLRQQTAFSVPPGQMPLIIPPRGERGLQVCFAPLVPEAGRYEDTLIIGGVCVTRTLLLRSELRGQEYRGYDRCGMLIRTRQRVARAYVEPPVPQPATAEVRIRFGVPGTSLVQLALHDLRGQRLLWLVNERLTAGVYTLDMPVQSLPEGLYWLWFQVDSTLQGYPLLIVR
ncbi:MAG: IgGFc-binding protein [Candidatus Kapabacteria bacterium]|nr:IgGFc-binding protein [Candidatus Kapabacteria bacterium]